MEHQADDKLVEAPSTNIKESEHLTSSGDPSVEEAKEMPNEDPNKESEPTVEEAKEIVPKMPAEDKSADLPTSSDKQDEPAVDEKSNNDEVTTAVEQSNEEPEIETPGLPSNEQNEPAITASSIVKEDTEASAEPITLETREDVEHELAKDLHETPTPDQAPGIPVENEAADVVIESVAHQIRKLSESKPIDESIVPEHTNVASEEQNETVPESSTNAEITPKLASSEQAVEINEAPNVELPSFETPPVEIRITEAPEQPSVDEEVTKVEEHHRINDADPIAEEAKAEEPQFSDFPTETTSAKQSSLDHHDQKTEIPIDKEVVEHDPPESTDISSDQSALSGEQMDETTPIKEVKQETEVAEKLTETVPNETEVVPESTEHEGDGPIIKEEVEFEESESVPKDELPAVESLVKKELSEFAESTSSKAPSVTYDDTKRELELFREQQEMEWATESQADAQRSVPPDIIQSTARHDQTAPLLDGNSWDQNAHFSENSTDNDHNAQAFERSDNNHDVQTFERSDNDQDPQTLERSDNDHKVQTLERSDNDHKVQTLERSDNNHDVQQDNGVVYIPCAQQNHNSQSASSNNRTTNKNYHQNDKQRPSYHRTTQPSYGNSNNQVSTSNKHSYASNGNQHLNQSSGYSGQQNHGSRNNYPRNNIPNGIASTSANKPALRVIVQYDWQTLDRPVVAKMPPEYASFYEPRHKPRYSEVNIGLNSHRINPTEYLIAFSNGVVAVGMIKYEKDIGTQPLAIQIGYWNSDAASELCVGTTVVVRAFAKMYKPKSDEFKPIAIGRANEPELFRGDCIFANALAMEWAVVTRPPLECALGVIKEFTTKYEPPTKSQSYAGTVYDQENDIDVPVANDLWSSRRKGIPDIKNAVVLTWAEVSEPHAIYQKRDGPKQMLPEYAPHYLSIGANKTEQYWLVSVDKVYPNNRFA